VTLFDITPAERAGWQRRAVRELTAILDAHRNLPVIAWTVAHAGATLVGHVNGPDSAGRIREVFDVWRVALALPEHTETTSGSGAVHLRALANRNQVRVGVTATVCDDKDQAR
jgi:hypothetical protein